MSAPYGGAQELIDNIAEGWEDNPDWKTEAIRETR